MTVLHDTCKKSILLEDKRIELSRLRIYTVDVIF